MRHSSLLHGTKSALAFLALASTLLITGCSGSGGGSAPGFTVSDFDGNWSMHGVGFALPNDGTLNGWINLNASGDVLGGIYDYSNGLQADVSGGFLAISDNGEINGTAIAETDGIDHTFDVYSGKMAPSKEFFAWVDTSSGIKANDLGTAIKQGGTFATSDLAGKWYLFGSSVGGELGSTEGTIWGKFELDANGKLDSGDISTSDDLIISVESGSFVLGPGGEVSGIVTANAEGEEFNVTVDSGNMTPSREIMFMTTQTGHPLNSNEMIAAVKTGGILPISLLAGRWYLHGVGMGGTFGKSAMSGYMDVDANGKITGGAYISKGEESQQSQILSGEVHFDINEKVVKGGFLTRTGDIDTNTTITYGQVSASKDVAVMVTEDESLGANGFVIAIKGE